MTTEQLQQKVRAILMGRYPDYMTKKAGERVLLAYSVLANDLRVRESGGNNHGDMVEAIIGSTGLDPEGGYSWCAATAEFCCEVAAVTLGPRGTGSAGVAKWREWASQNNRLMLTPARGRLCTLIHPDGTGHMGDTAEVKADGRLRTYEGNTSSGSKGSQSNGDGLYERIRPAGFFTRYISLD